MSRPEVRLRCPLTWPEGWPRVRPGDRQRGLFHQRGPAPHGAGAAIRPVGLTVPAAIDRLRAELDRLGAVPEVLTTHHPVRLDGRLRTLSDRELTALDPGAAVYFSLKGEPASSPATSTRAWPTTWPRWPRTSTRSGPSSGITSGRSIRSSGPTRRCPRAHRPTGRASSGSTGGRPRAT